MSAAAEPVQGMTAEQRKQYGCEWMLERAAILEFEGHWPREQAEVLAVAEWRKLCATVPELQVQVERKAS